MDYLVQAFIKATNSTQQGFYYPSITVGYCLLFSMFLVAVSRAPVESTYTRSFMLLRNVDGSLTTLSATKGFRNYVKAYADKIGVTGLIQRYHHKDVRIWFEGLADQHAQFLEFIKDCINIKMVEYVECEKEDSYHKRKLYDGFKILTDFS
jgi:acylphosphatase